MNKTDKQFAQAIKICRELFEKKMKDYGTAWRVLRTSSLTDQILIKAQRIRSIETKGKQKIEEGIKPEYIGIINYAIIALIQLELGPSDDINMNPEKTIQLYDKYAKEAQELMNAKNHDYDEAWRSMRVSSYTDLVLMKVFRTKQIEDNEGKTLVSEGVAANYFDMINYSAFALIKLEFEP